MTLLTFAGLVLAWYLLHRASRQREWGFVGTPLTKQQIALRRAVRSIIRTHETLASQLHPVLVELTASMQEFLAAMHRAIPPRLRRELEL